MIEILKEQREHYVEELERIKSKDLSTYIEEKVAKAREAITADAERELSREIDEAREKVEHYDFVIANIEREEQEKSAVEVAVGSGEGDSASCVDSSEVLSN